MGQTRPCLFLGKRQSEVAALSRVCPVSQEGTGEAHEGAETGRHVQVGGQGKQVEKELTWGGAGLRRLAGPRCTA